MSSDLLARINKLMNPTDDDGNSVWPDGYAIQQQSPVLLLELLEAHEEVVRERDELKAFYDGFQDGIAKQAEARRLKFKRMYVTGEDGL